MVIFYWICFAIVAIAYLGFVIAESSAPKINNQFIKNNTTELMDNMLRNLLAFQYFERESITLENIAPSHLLEESKKS